MNECTQFEALEIQRFYDGELAPVDAGRFAAHVAACAACRRAVGEFSEVSRWLNRGPAAAVPAGLRDRCVQRARELQIRKTRRIAWGLAMAASFLLASSLMLVRYSQADAGDSPAFVAQWEENVVLPPVVEEDFTDLDTRTLVAIHIQSNVTSEVGNE